VTNGFVWNSVALSLASHLDLNDLHALSLTCHQFHDNLVQFSSQLISHSLRCSNASQQLLSDIVTSYNDSLVIRDTAGNTIGRYTGTQVIPNALLAAWSSSSSNQSRDTSNLLPSRKIGACARDLVADCRKCGKIVCRNCTGKPPSDRLLQDRVRRLCRACLDAPLQAHLQAFKKVEDRIESPPVSSSNSEKSVGSRSSSPIHLLVRDAECFTSSAFLRGPCTCSVRGVYLCATCGQNLRSADTTYKRVWTWRSRYSTHIGGGLGTGLGEGDQGQKCGRGEECLESGSGGVCWVEIDCSESNKYNGHFHGDSSSSGYNTENEPETSERDRDKPGYLQQEIEGIGGVVKKKVKKRVKVGATVWEYDDERETGKYLERESSGKERSWCGWCSRVVPGEADIAEMVEQSIG
jgi:hypothetical protein